MLEDASRIYTWISTAIWQYNVQELYIKLREVKGFVTLRYCLYTCKTLTSLHLDMLCVLKLPTIICFLSLKILSIQGVTFFNEHLT
jgi:hypothetical protein